MAKVAQQGRQPRGTLETLDGDQHLWHPSRVGVDRGGAMMVTLTGDQDRCLPLRPLDIVAADSRSTPTPRVTSYILWFIVTAPWGRGWSVWTGQRRRVLGVAGERAWRGGSPTFLPSETTITVDLGDGDTHLVRRTTTMAVVDIKSRPPRTATKA